VHPGRHATGRPKHGFRGQFVDIPHVRPGDVVDAALPQWAEPSMAVTSTIHTLHERGQLPLSFSIAEQSDDERRTGLDRLHGIA
jgi:hypothetical protein